MLHIGFRGRPLYLKHRFEVVCNMSRCFHPYVPCYEYQGILSIVKELYLAFLQICANGSWLPFVVPLCAHKTSQFSVFKVIQRLCNNAKVNISPHCKINSS